MRMMRIARWLTIAAMAAAVAAGQGFLFSGKVEMADGTPLPRSAMIERLCGIGRISVLGQTDKKGNYIVQLAEFDPFTSAARKGGLAMNRCFLRAVLSGYESTHLELDIAKPINETRLPVLKLRPKGAGSRDAGIPDRAPKAASKAWDRAVQAVKQNKWTEAESHLSDVVKLAPKFAAGWSLLGVACQNQDHIDDARSHFHRAIEADPKATGPLYLLVQLEVNAARWEAARDAAQRLIKADGQHRYPEAFLYDAVSRYNLGDADGAEASAKEALRHDPQHKIPRIEYVLAKIAESRRDIPSALEHFRKYIETEPNAVDVQSVRARIDKLARGEAIEADPTIAAANLTLSVSSDVWIPGGFKALGSIAHVDSKTFSRNEFFDGYCRAIVRYNSPNEGSGIPGYLDTLRAYFSAIADLSRIGESRDGRTVVSLSLAPERRKATEQALALFGWRVSGSRDQLRVELTESEADVPRQWIATALGVDVISMAQALESGKTFDFEIFSEQARLIGGDTWVSMVETTRPMAGGLAEAFAEESRLAKAYVGLNAMPPETAEAVISALGARNAGKKFADLLLKHGSAVRMAGGIVSAPGGAGADAAWQRLTGTSPRNGPAFVRAIFEKDRGTMMAFYAAVAGADDDRQRLFTAENNASRAYGWFTQVGVQRTVELIRAFPVDAVNGVPSDAAAAERQIAAHRMGLDTESAALVIKHYDEWSPLFPYVERLKAFRLPEFQALEKFTAALGAATPDRRESLLGTWYSALELIALARERGSVNPRQAADAFRQICQISRPSDSIAVLRSLTGAAGNFDDAIKTSLLRLDAERRGRFDRVLALQNVPSLDEAVKLQNEPNLLLALIGMVYAAHLPPTGLLISEDRGLVRRHRFSRDDAPFQTAALVRPEAEAGGRFTGGFARFADLAGKLAEGGATGDAAAKPAAPPAVQNKTNPIEPVPVEAPSQVFRTDARLVMVPTTVTDGRGHYIDDLNAADFEIVEDGRAHPALQFEPYSSAVSCALLLDTTGSMYLALPALKAAALRFIQDLRPIDSVAVYSFSDSVSLLEPFTTDKDTAKRAVLRTFAQGHTALYDALARVSRDMGNRGGKKVIVVFTDGEDNASTLAADLAIRRMKSTGVAVYTIAQGQAVDKRELLKQLDGLSTATGGLPFVVRSAPDISAVFERIAEDLAHGYLLSFQPSASSAREWHKIDVVVKGTRRFKVRAREGYYTE